MAATKKRLKKNFGTPGNRTKNIRAMYKAVREDTQFPEIAVDSLDVLISSVLEGNPPRGAVLSGSFDFDLCPPVRHTRGRRKTRRYPLDFFGRNFFFGTYDAKDPHMHVGIRIFGDSECSITAKLDGKIIYKKDALHGTDIKALEDRLFYFDKIRKEYFRKSTGIAIKITNSQGKFSFGEQMFIFGEEHAHKYVFVFFKNGETYFFDDEGEPAFVSLSRGELSTQRALRRRLQVMRNYTACSVQQCSVRAIEYLHRIFFREAGSLPRYGKSLLIRGNFDRETSSWGDLVFPHYAEGNKKDVFFVGSPKTRVKVYWKGPHVLFYNVHGKLLNASKVDTPGIETDKPSIGDGIIEAVAIRDFPDYLRFAFNGNMHRFSSQEVRGYLEKIPPRSAKGLMMHIHPDGNSYWLLARQKGAVQSYPLLDVRVT